VSVCLNAPGVKSGDACFLPEAGDVCAEVLGQARLSEPYSLGVLFAQNGAEDRVRYADYSLWSGDALPEPANCPAVSGFQLCGAACGSCPVGQVCSGQSPLHPYGMCFPGDALACSEGCPAGTSCFAFVVQPQAQALADQYSICLPSAVCMAAGDGLPGGATCSAP
jgi:hypothetical protein